MSLYPIGEAILMVFDALRNDDQSSNIIDLIDGGESDAEIKDGLQKGVIRLKQLGHNDIAEKIESKMKGW